TFHFLFFLCFAYAYGAARSAAMNAFVLALQGRSERGFQSNFGGLGPLCRPGCTVVFGGWHRWRHGMATLYTVQTAAGVLHAELTADEAASMLKVDPLELEWAIEEDGLCSTVDDQGKDIISVALRDEWRLQLH